MPPKRDAKTSHVGSVPGNNSNGTGAGTPPAPMEVDLTKESVKDKVSQAADEFEKLFYAYGEQLKQATQEVLEKAKGIDSQSAKAVSESWTKVRQEMQPQLNRCLVQLEAAVPEGDEVVPDKEVAHPGARAVAFRDLLENARADITGSLEELIQWFVDQANDPAAIRALASSKQATYARLYDSVLDKMGRDIRDRMTNGGSIQVDFGRDSDYGQALKAQQDLAKDRDDLQLQLEGFQKQVEDLKASEADLYDKCTELQDKFTRAQNDLLATRDKVCILDSVTKFLGTDSGNVDARSRVAELESQLRTAQDANVNLQSVIADYEKELASGSGGPRKSLVERAREIGFVSDASGRLQLGSPPRQVFDVSRPYCYTSRCG